MLPLGEPRRCVPAAETSAGSPTMIKSMLNKSQTTIAMPYAGIKALAGNSFFVGYLYCDRPACGEHRASLRAGQNRTAKK